MLLDLHAKECHFPTWTSENTWFTLDLSLSSQSQSVGMSGHFSVLVKSVPFFYTFISPLEYLIGQMYFFFQILPPLKCSMLWHVLSRHKFATNTSILLYIYQQIKFLVSSVCYPCLHPPTHTKINKLAPDTESPTCLKKRKQKNSASLQLSLQIQF